MFGNQDPLESDFVGTSTERSLLFTVVSSAGRNNATKTFKTSPECASRFSQESSVSSDGGLNPAKAVNTKGLPMLPDKLYISGNHFLLSRFSNSSEKELLSRCQKSDCPSSGATCPVSDFSQPLEILFTLSLATD